MSQPRLHEARLLSLSSRAHAWSHSGANVCDEPLLRWRPLDPVRLGSTQSRGELAMASATSRPMAEGLRHHPPRGVEQADDFIPITWLCTPSPPGKPTPSGAMHDEQ